MIAFARAAGYRIIFKWRVLSMITLFLAAIVISFTAGYGLRDISLYHEQYVRERKMIEPIIAADKAFGKIHIIERSNGGIELIGSVRSEYDYDRLLGEITHLIGNSRAKETMRALYISDFSSNP